MSAAQGSYYLPDPSPWPIVGSVSLFTLAIGAVTTINGLAAGPYFLIAGILLVATTMGGWFGKVVTESESGAYNDHVDASFRMSMAWFIFSEVMFFGAFFGALFYVRNLAVPWLSDTPLLWPEFSGGWPTAGPGGALAVAPGAHVGEGEFSPMGAWGIPMLNTALLLSSSVTITIAHWALKAGERGKLITWLLLTVLLGAAFLAFQAYEYHHAYTELGLTLGTGVYGATFFMLTGFHGFHVTIGAVILTVILVRCILGHFKPDHHFAFEAGAWYWHFVDTVWVCLFLFVYVL